MLLISDFNSCATRVSAITILIKMNLKHFRIRKPSNFHNVREMLVTNRRSVSVHTQSLFQSGLLHLLSHEIVPAVATLPYQPDLMT